MISHPALKSCYHVEVFNSTTVFLLAETGHKVLRGSLFVKVVPLLNGQHSVDEIISSLRHEASAAEVMYILMSLENAGYLVEHDYSIPTGIAAFWHALGLDSSDANQSLRNTIVSVSSLTHISPLPMISALQSLNITCGDSGNLLVILVEDYLQEGIALLNQESLSSERTWMLIKPIGSQLWIGPILRPGVTGCWECLAYRLRRNRQVEGLIARNKQSSLSFPTSIATLNTTVQLAVNTAATEILKWIIANENPKLEGQLLTIDTLSLDLKEHRVSQRPHCPACGAPKQDNNESPCQITLKSRKKWLLAEEGYRLVSPEDVLATYKHLVSPITGVVSVLQRLPDWKNGPVYNFYSGPNLALHSGDWILSKGATRGHSGGKGRSSSQAEASALCEAIERFSWVFQGDEPRKFGSYRELGGEAIHPSTCLNFSLRQYELREKWNARCSRIYFKVPEPFNELMRIDWTPVWSLTLNKCRYVPTLYCYCDYPTTYQFCYPDTNGNAAGSCREEAILQGFLEVVERDAVGIWWFNRLKRPAVDLDTFGDPYFKSIVKFYKSLGRQMWVLDVTSDLDIPTFAAISIRIDQEEEEIIFGFGSHLSAQIAIVRAITEMNQFLPLVHTSSSGASVGYANCSDEMREWLQTARVAIQPYLLPSQVDSLRIASDYPSVQSEDLRDDVMYCVAVAKEHGLETLVLDQTRTDIGLHVVKVIVPGLRHFWRRVGPGRLYDVPVKMGWLRAPLSEEELNQVSVFF